MLVSVNRTTSSTSHFCRCTRGLWHGCAGIFHRMPSDQASSSSSESRICRNLRRSNIDLVDPLELKREVIESLRWWRFTSRNVPDDIAAMSESMEVAKAVFTEGFPAWNCGVIHVRIKAQASSVISQKCYILNITKTFDTAFHQAGDRVVRGMREPVCCLPRTTKQFMKGALLSCIFFPSIRLLSIGKAAQRFWIICHLALPFHVRLPIRIRDDLGNPRVYRVFAVGTTSWLIFSKATCASEITVLAVLQRSEREVGELYSS